MPDAETSQVSLSAAVITRRIDDRLGALFQKEISRWNAIDPAMGALTGTLSELVRSGGKRLRPIFCYWSYVGAGGDPDDNSIVDTGIALEVLHTMALVHDDVMDGSLMRRGRDTVHRAFDTQHSTQGWNGESRRFGEGVAILVGDLAHSYADGMIPAVPEVKAIFDELKLELVYGQYVDMLGTARRNRSSETARKIALYKSAKYTVERPLHLGAALTGRLGELSEQLTAFGLPLGEAFQMKDDLLGAFGEPDSTGKPVGSDLIEGKPTSLFSIAFERANDSEKHVLYDLYGKSDLDSAGIDKILEVFERTGARASIEETARELVEKSIAALQAATLAPEAVKNLSELAKFVVDRKY